MNLRTTGMLRLHRGDLWGRPTTDPAVRAAEAELRAKAIIVRARQAAPGFKKNSLYEATNARGERKPISSSIRFVEDMIEARAPWDDIEALAMLVVDYARQRRADLESIPLRAA